MYIRRIRIKRFRHIRDTDIGPLGAPPQQSDLVALVGPNGSGKSSILELLGHALSHSWSLTWRIRRSFPASSFEVEIGLTPAEFSLVKGRLDDPSDSELRALEYLEEKKGYARSFGYDDGDYATDPTLHNQAHSLVTSALRDHHNRSLGFFLRSDRTYPFQKYEQRKLLQNHRRAERKHIWNLAFNTSDIQYQDMYDFLVEQQYHFDRRLGAYYRRSQAGELDDGQEEPTNPIEPYDRLLGRLFQGYFFTEAPQDIPDNLYVKIPSGERIPFQDLSSGEKEVFFILSFFLRNDVKDAVIVLDEPELHLHPELGRLLVRTMQDIRPGNQIWVGTHSGEIIDEAGRDRMYFLSRDPSTRLAKATPATQESEAAQLLRDLFGFSGYLGVARAMVFTEGRGASVDRKVFGKLFSAESGAVRIIPSGGSDALPRINAAVLSILNSTFSSCEFFLIRDRDYLTAVDAEAMRSRSRGHLWVLQRNQIENYLLEPEIIAAVENEILGKPVSPSETEDLLREAARTIAGETLRDMLAFRMNRAFAPQDFSLDQILQNQTCIDGNGEWLEAPISALTGQFQLSVAESLQELQRTASASAVSAMIEDCKTTIGAAVGGDGWRKLMPGKRLIEEYVRLRGHSSALVPAMTNSLVKYLSASPAGLTQEFQEIIESI